jgi:hypothetical protein
MALIPGPNQNQTGASNSSNVSQTHFSTPDHTPLRGAQFILVAPLRGTDIRLIAGG